MSARGHVLTDWHPEDIAHWDGKLAWRTLAVTTNEEIGRASCRERV